jgi:type II secretory pathway pseudopilin PulG
MPTLPLQIAPGILMLFMMALAVVPLMLVWFDERRRAREEQRLAVLRRQAALRVMLAAQSADERDVKRGVRVANG